MQKLIQFEYYVSFLEPCEKLWQGKGRSRNSGAGLPSHDRDGSSHQRDEEKTWACCENSGDPESAGRLCRGGPHQTWWISPWGR